MKKPIRMSYLLTGEFCKSLFDMSESITKSLCDKELLSEPEPPLPLRERSGILYTPALWIISRQRFFFGKAVYFSSCQLKGFVLDVTLQSVCSWYQNKDLKICFKRSPVAFFKSPCIKRLTGRGGRCSRLMVSPLLNTTESVPCFSSELPFLFF